jgi:hypothetical protein
MLREVVDGHRPANVKEATPLLLARDSTGPALRQVPAQHTS